MVDNASLPPAPPEENEVDACCPTCGSLFHSAEFHTVERSGGARAAAMAGEFPPGYDPAEADRLIGRTPGA